MAVSGQIGAGISSVGANETGTTGAINALPLIASQGASNAVALAMETFSASMNKNGTWTDPRVPEQGVIELGFGSWTMEKTFTLDLSLASTSRFGLTIRGQGPQSTLLNITSTAAAANFKGGDSVWRAMNFKNSDAAKTQGLVLEKLGVVSYATQGGDGSTPLADACRWIEAYYALTTSIRDVHVYMRSPTALSLNQYCVALENCYYSRLDAVRATMFNVTSSTGYALDGTVRNRRGGVGFRFKNNNALTATGLLALGVNLGFHLIDEDGLTMHGGACEQHNKAFLFDGDSASNRVFGFRSEFNHMVNSVAMESSAETYFAKFCEQTFDNYVEQFSGANVPVNLIIDKSAKQTNRVFAPNTRNRQRPTYNVLTGLSWTNGAGASSAAGASNPSHLDASLTSSVAVTMTGGYNIVRYTSAFAVNPDLGSVYFRVFAKRVSGAGFMSPEIATVVNGGSSAVLFFSRIQNPGQPWQTNTTIPMASGSWAANKLTMVSRVPHGLQAGMRLQSGTSWGTLTAATNLYVESVTDEKTFVLIAASGGTITNPGTITSPGAATVPSDMIYWQQCPDMSQWQELAGNVAIRVNSTTAPSLDGSTQAVVSVSGLGLVTGAKLKLSGFADSRLNVAYTVQSGDVSGTNLTLTALGTLAGLVTTATNSGPDGSPVYGQVGLTEVCVQWRCSTTNTGQNIVWETAGESVIQGAA